MSRRYPSCHFSPQWISKVLLSAALPLCLSLSVSVGHAEMREAQRVASSVLDPSQNIVALDRSASIKGPDADNNGIRDDIDAYLASKHYSAPKLAAAQQDARAMQRILLVNVANHEEVRRAQIASMGATKCLVNRFGVSGENFDVVASTIEKLTVNTKERAAAYMAYGKALDGTTFSLPHRDTCEN